MKMILMIQIKMPLQSIQKLKVQLWVQKFSKRALLLTNVQKMDGSLMQKDFICLKDSLNFAG